MTGSRGVETVAKALRRQAQLKRWQRQSRKLQESPAVPVRTARHSHFPTLDSPEQRNQQFYPSHASTFASPSSTSPTASASSEANFPEKLSSVSHTSRTLQRAYWQRDKAQFSAPLERDLRDFLRHSPSKEDCCEAFFLTASTDLEALSPSVVSEFTSTILRHNLAAQMGVKAYESALRDAIGASEDSRWGQVDQSERRGFALYQARRLGRYSVKGTSFQKDLRITLEGSDNDTVALTEYHLRRSSSASKVLSASSDALLELVNLDVSWTTALQVYTYAKELSRVDPPADMTTRLMALMTGYKTNALGSRPWRRALELYERLQSSGYDVPLDAHTAALDAIWRSGDSFARPHHCLSTADRECMWASLVRIRERVPDSQLTGDGGCRFSEALIKAAAAAGRWDTCVQLIGNMDITLDATSHRMLLPTAETFLFAMASCNAARNAAYADALYKTFSALYTLRSAHPEALLTYLQSLRNVVELSSQVGPLVESLVLDGKGLDRPCCVACLQLLASQRINTQREEKWKLGLKIWRFYESNPWPQQPQVRKAELQTVFRCCHLIAAASPHPVTCPLLPELRAHLASVWGSTSTEAAWLEDTEVYTLHTTHSWADAISVFQRQVTGRALERVTELPIPLRQARHMFAQALLRCARAAVTTKEEEGFLLEEERQSQEQVATCDFMSYAVHVVRSAYSDTCDTPPHEVLAELLLLQALCSSRTDERQKLALDAMRELYCGVASAITPRIVDLVAQALSLTEEHVQSVLLDGGVHLRAKALQRDEPRSITARGFLETVFL